MKYFVYRTIKSKAKRFIRGPFKRKFEKKVKWMPKFLKIKTLYSITGYQPVTVDDRASEFKKYLIIR